MANAGWFTSTWWSDGWKVEVETPNIQLPNLTRCQFDNATVFKQPRLVNSTFIVSALTHDF